MPPFARQVQPWMFRRRRSRALGLVIGACIAVGAWLPVKLRHREHVGAKWQATEATIRHFVFDVYPYWAARHPLSSCPRSLSELDARETTYDAYGTPLYFACGPLMVPNAATGMLVISAGDDGKFGTGDDVRSDRL
jgi:hypothetical protein